MTGRAETLTHDLKAHDDGTRVRPGVSWRTCMKAHEMHVPIDGANQAHMSKQSERLYDRSEK